MKIKLRTTTNPPIYKIKEIERRLDMYKREVINIISSKLYKQPLMTLRCRPHEVNGWLKRIPAHLEGFMNVISPLAPNPEIEKMLNDLAYRCNSVRNTLKHSLIPEKIRWESRGSYLLDLLHEGRSLCEHLLNHPGYDSCA